MVFLILIGTAEREKEKEGMAMTIKVSYSVSIGQVSHSTTYAVSTGSVLPSCKAFPGNTHNYEYGSDWKMTPMI